MAAAALHFSSIISSSAPRTLPPRRQKIGKPLSKILHGILGERDPDKLVSEFVAASALPRPDPRVRGGHLPPRRPRPPRRRGRHHRRAEALPFLGASSTKCFAALYGRASMSSHAAATFRELPPRHKSVAAFNALLAAYADAGDFDAMAAALEDIPVAVVERMDKHGQPKLDSVSYTELIRGYCKQGRLDEAIKLYYDLGIW